MPGNESIGLKTHTIYDYSGGMVTNYNFVKVATNQYNRLLNGDLIKDGTVMKRRGRQKLNLTGIATNPSVTSLAALGRSGTSDLILAGAEGTLYEINSTTVTTIRSGLDASAFLANTPLDNFLFYCNGVNQPFMTSGTAAATYQVGITQVTNAQYAGVSAATVGVVGYDATPGNHRVAFRYRSSITGARSKPYIVSDVIQSATVNIPAINNGYRITIGAATVSTDSQVDNIDVFVQEAAAAADAPYYFLGSCNNIANFYDFGTLVDDGSLIIKERLDIDDNVAPTTLRDIETWRGRLLGITGDYTIGYSKQRIDANSFVNLPTSWPSTNEIEVGYGDGDPLVKVVRFFDYVLAFKRKSIWILLGDFDSPDFGFRRLKTNYTAVGLLGQRAIAQAGDNIYFVSDDLKFHRFGVTDFSTTELRLTEPCLSDRVNDIFTTFASSYRNNVNVINYTFSQYTQVWISFSNGSNGLDASQNFNTFVYDYTTDGGKGGWHIHTGHEVASAVLARDSARNYNVYTGDYYGFVWKHSDGPYNGDGAEINGTSTGSNTITTFNDTTESFTTDLIGCLVRIIDGTGPNQIRRIIGVPTSTQLTVDPAWSIVPNNTSTYTIGGIDFEFWSRYEWCDMEAPPDFDKYGWYLDVDVETEGDYGFTVQLLKDRRLSLATAIARDLSFFGSLWGYGIWGTAIWAETSKDFAQIGFDLYFKQIQHRIINELAGQNIKLNGHTYTFQTLGHVRRV